MAAILNLVDIYDAESGTFTQQLGLNKGADYRLVIQLFSDEARTLPLDLTGYVADASLKAGANDVASLADFNCTFSPDRSDGKIYLHIQDAVLQAIPTTGKSYAEKLKMYWDMYIMPTGGDRMRLYNGLAELSPSIASVGSS